MKKYLEYSDEKAQNLDNLNTAGRSDKFKEDYDVRGKDFHLKIRETKKGVYYAQVREKTDKGLGAVIWRFEISKENNSIKKAEMYDKTKFYILDRELNLWFYDIDGKKLLSKRIVDKKGMLINAVLTLDKKYLLLPYYQYDDYESKIVRIDLSTLEIDDEMIVKNISTSQCWQNERGELFFYFCRNDKAHRIVKVDFENKTSRSFSLPNPPHDRDEHYPVFSFKHNKVILYHYDKVETRMVDNEKLFLHKLDIVDLDTFLIEKTIVTREFKQKYHGYDLEDKEKNGYISEYVLEKMLDERDDFYNDLYTIYISEDEPAFWCCFRGGIFRKITFDGRRSALLVFSDRKYDNIEEYLYKRNIHMYIAVDLTTDNRIVFYEHGRYYEFNPNEFSIENENDVIISPLQKYVDKDKVKTVDTIDAAVDGNNKLDSQNTLIEMDDFESEAAFKKALKDLVEISKDFSKYRQGMYLSFLFKDKAGKTMKEKEFFQRVIEFKGTDREISRIIRNFVNYKGSYLYYDSETVSLSYAMEALVLSDIKYLDLYGDYLMSLDLEHEVYHSRKLIWEVIDTYMSTKELIDFLVKIFFSEWSMLIEDHFSSKRSNSKDPLYVFITQADNWKYFTQEISNKMKEENYHDIDDIEEYLSGGSSFFKKFGMEILRNSGMIVFWAIEKGKKKLAKDSIRDGIDINIKDKDGNTPLLAALKDSYYDIANLLIKQGADVNAADKYGRTPLFIVSEKGNSTIVKLLIKKGADINAVDKKGVALLMAALKNSHYDIANLLIKKEADVNSIDEDGRTPLFIALENDEYDLVKSLIKQGADINAQCKDERTPLFYAVENDEGEITKLLVEGGADVNISNQKNQTPLMYSSSLSIMSLLIDNGANINAQDKYGITALIIMINSDEVEMAKLLMDRGADVNIQSNLGDNAFTFAAVRGNIEIIKLLLDKGVDVNVKNSCGGNALMAACTLEEDELAEKAVGLLLEKGANMNEQDEYGETALIKAAAMGLSQTSRLLIGKGADINLQDKKGEAALMKASAKGLLGLVELMLEYGANINGKNKKGQTALMLAVESNKVNVVKLLIEKGADVYLADRNADTALSIALKNKLDGEMRDSSSKKEGGINLAEMFKGWNMPLSKEEKKYDDEIIDLLMKKGAQRPSFMDQYIKNLTLIEALKSGDVYKARKFIVKEGEKIIEGGNIDSALLVASEGGSARFADEKEEDYIEIANLLLYYGADINTRNHIGNTPLMCAINQDFEEMAKTLIDKGSETKAVNELGKTSLTMASEKGHTEIIDLLASK